MKENKKIKSYEEWIAHVNDLKEVNHYRKNGQQTVMLPIAHGSTVVAVWCEKTNVGFLYQSN